MTGLSSSSNLWMSTLLEVPFKSASNIANNNFCTSVSQMLVVQW